MDETRGLRRAGQAAMARKVWRRSLRPRDLRVCSLAHPGVAMRPGIGLLPQRPGRSRQDEGQP